MKKLLLVFLLVPCLIVPAHAEGYISSVGDELDASSVREELPGEIREIGGELRFDGGYDGTGALERLWDRFLAQIAESLRDGAREVFALLALVLLCSLGLVLTQGQKQAETIQIAGCASAACLMADGMNSLIGRAVNSLTSLHDYAVAALPAIYSAAAASGAPTSASARYGASCLVLDLMMSASQKLLLPLFLASIAMAVCGSIFDNPLLRSMLRLSKKLSTVLMTGLSAVFTGFLSVTGIVTGSVDAAAVKMTRTVVSAAVPVVGKIMSEAAASVLTAAAVVRNTAGAYGLVAVCALCSAPFASFGVRRLLFALVAALAETTAGARLSRLLAEFSSLMGMLLGLVASYGLMLFLSIVSAIRTVTG